MAEGVDLVFGYPGGANMPIYDALFGARDRVRHVLVRHEQGAGHAAEGYARASGRPGVCMGTSGPGATNLLTALADALMDSTPLVAITGQVASPKLGTDAFQEADAVGMSLPATRWAWQVTSPAEIPWAVRMAFAVARGAIAGPGPEHLARKPGPVLLDITRDAQTGPARVSRRERTAPRPGRRPPVAPMRETPYPAPFRVRGPASPPGAADGEETRREGSTRPRARAAPASGPDRRELVGKCEAAARLLNRAERPYVLAGHGVTLAGAEAELREVAERGRLPVGLTLLGLSALPSDHPLNVGLLGMHGNYGANVLTNEADVILAVGMRFDDRVTGNLDTYARDARIIHIDIDPSEIGKAVPAEVAVVADARAALAVLASRIRPPAGDGDGRAAWLERFREHDALEREAVIDAELGGTAPEIRMGEAVHVLGRASRGEAVIVSDVGQHQMHAGPLLPLRPPPQPHHLRRARHDGLRAPRRDRGEARSAGSRGRRGHRRRRLPDDPPGARHGHAGAAPRQGPDPRQRLSRHGPTVAVALLRRALLGGRPREPRLRAHRRWPTGSRPSAFRSGPTSRERSTACSRRTGPGSSRSRSAGRTTCSP